MKKFEIIDGKWIKVFVSKEQFETCKLSSIVRIDYNLVITHLAGTKRKISLFAMGAPPISIMYFEEEEELSKSDLDLLENLIFSFK